MRSAQTQENARNQGSIQGDILNKLRRYALASCHCLSDPRKGLFVGFAPVFLPPTCMR